MALLSRLQQCALQAGGVGGQSLAAAGLRLAHSAAGGGAGEGQQKVQTRHAASTPTTLPELPPRQPDSERRLLCLNSINDPSNYGLAASPAGSGEPAYYWLGSSVRDPMDVHHTAVCPAGARTGSPSPLPTQGFRTAVTRQSMQRVVFRSSMIDPEPVAFHTSMADPPLPPLGEGRKGHTDN